MKDTDKVFKALADPCRRELLDRLHARNGQTLTELCAGLEMTRQAVTQHLGLLEEAIRAVDAAGLHVSFVPAGTEPAAEGPEFGGSPLLSSRQLGVISGN